MRNSDRIKNEILDEYYLKVYQDVFFAGGVQGRGIEYFESQVEKFWSRSTPRAVLEIGGGNGEHLRYLKYIPATSYTSLDIRDRTTSEHLQNLPAGLLNCLSFVKGDAEEIPFEDSSFDRVFTTCLLHHVNDPLQVLLEIRRVTETGGEIALLFPTDPGLFNQSVKRIFTSRKIGKISRVRPQLIYALEHRNHALSIMELIRFVFEKDDLQFKFKPFSWLHSYNLNLLIVAKIIKL